MTMSGGFLGALYHALLKIKRDAVEACCEDVGIDLDDYRAMVTSYQTKDYPFSGNHSHVAAWFVAKAGPRLGCGPAEFEVIVSGAREASVDRVVNPAWALAAPVSNPIDGRLPAVPFVGPDQDLAAALGGLLAHVTHRNELRSLAGRELALSSVLWRVVTIAERLKENLGPSTGLQAKLASVYADLKGATEIGAVERRYCDALRPELTLRRNALTHFSDGSGIWSFARAAQACLTDEEELWECAAAINLAVLRVSAIELRAAAPPRARLQAALHDINW
ncbi:MAG: hypothetical protein MUF00_20840 [Gemmatimonadaceae bacterium]|jgi:hypothetical protein|nr:hypothetical protein [Gemmatimonadaceae bacterium]